jgi:hypothetical protein
MSSTYPYSHRVYWTFWPGFNCDPIFYQICWFLNIFTNPQTLFFYKKSPFHWMRTTFAKSFLMTFEAEVILCKDRASTWLFALGWLTLGELGTISWECWCRSWRGPHAEEQRPITNNQHQLPRQWIYHLKWILGSQPSLWLAPVDMWPQTHQKLWAGTAQLSCS